ncbi:MAG TPA: ATP-dependent Clp protease ATP-binding subunit [Candidatus Dormibacteraeota bacterium]|nr:ATP-dependent Clp protease ATP-binding subunit [Candidatus Dormibacteraeota bacterium]
MFERYTEKARRVIFFARYEASQYGSPYIETEHLLLGLMREDKALANRFLRSHGSIESIRKEIEQRITIRERISTSVEVPLSQESKRILNFATEEAERLGHKHVGTEHLLLGILREEKCFGAEILQERGLRLSTLREELARSAGEKAPSSRPKETSLLAEFSRDLTQAALEGQLDPLVGREREVERVIQILCRRTKNNPVLIGEPGVGKTAIVEGLAQRISDSDVPPFLADKRILSLDLSLIVAGTKYRGQFEERLKTIMKELMESQNSIIFIDELHTLVGAGSAEGSLDAANILKPALSRGEIQCIGATTPGEYRKSVEKDRSLERRFQSVKVGAPSEDEAIQVLEGVRERYEKFHAVSYTDEAVRYAVYLSSRYIPDRFLPDKAIDLIDEAGARVKLRQAMLPDEVAEVQKRVKFITHRMETAIANHEFEKARFYSEEERKEKENLRAVRERLKLDDTNTGVVTREDIEEVVARWTGINVSSIKEDEQQKLLRIEIELHKRVISQDKAITALARAIRRSRAGLKAPGRPVGCFLFLGPTGVGKTEVARRLAEFLFGSEKSLIRFDMSEYLEKHSVSKLIGAPPGYVGYEEGGQLTERVRRMPYSVILLDEIEKAHPDVYNILLQVFEDGQLTDGLGNTVDFRNTILIMTSNLGARHLQKRSTMGFQSAAEEGNVKSLDELVLSEVKRVFNPEFLNRLDEIILFNPLGDEELLRIIDLLVGQINDTLIHRQVQIVLTPEARQWILEKTCGDRSYGARPLRRALQKYVEDPLSEALIQGDLQHPATLEVYVTGDGLNFRPVVEATPVSH